MEHTWKLNTSNLGKFKEFERLFKLHGIKLEVTHIDLDEIDAGLIEVIAHKASQLEEGVIVEDTSLEIEGAKVGVNIRWLLEHLDQFEGKKAEWIVLLAYRKKDKVYVFKGSQLGQIVKAKGQEGFGFDPYFLPDGADTTLAESKPDQFNARAKAVEAFVKIKPCIIHEAIYKWDGKWQN
jgi:XTP/dITP diphosphohydrolase